MEAILIFLSHCLCSRHTQAYESFSISSENPKSKSELNLQKKKNFQAALQKIVNVINGNQESGF